MINMDKISVKCCGAEIDYYNEFYSCIVLWSGGRLSKVKLDSTLGLYQAATVKLFFSADRSLFDVNLSLAQNQLSGFTRC